VKLIACLQNDKMTFHVLSGMVNYSLTLILFLDVGRRAKSLKKMQHLHQQLWLLQCLTCHLNKYCHKWQSLIPCLVVSRCCCLSSKNLAVRVALYQTMVCSSCFVC